MHHVSHFRSNMHSSAIVIFTAMTAAGPVMGTDLFGGGSYFSARPYVGDDYMITVPIHMARTNLSRNTTNVVATTPIATLTPPNTVFARFASGTGHRISYCQTGSGTGKTVLTGVGSIINANGECGANTAPAGFSAPSMVPDYISTDVPLNQADVNDLNSGPRAARAVWQVPTMVGSVALSHHAGLGFTDLTTEQICRIFSARITNWSSIPGSGSTGQIQVVYRAGDSGTTLAFTSYLAAACNGWFGIPAGYFKPNQNFIAAVPAASYSTPPPYAASSAAANESGLVRSVTSTVGAIGYAGYAEVAAQGAAFSTINGASPAGLPASVSIPAPLSGQVLNANNNPVAVTGLTNPACLRLVNPYAIPPGMTYPILAYTYLAGYRNSNGGNVTALRSLLGYFLATQANRPAPPAGFAYLDGSATYRTSIQNTINTCIL